MLYWVIAVLFCFNMVWLLWWGMFFIWTWFLQCSLFLIGIYTKTAVNWWIKSGLGDFFSLILSVNLELETISVSPQRKCFFQFSWKTHICVHEKFILITVRLSSFLGNVVKISKVLQEKIKGAVWSMAVYVWKKKKNQDNLWYILVLGKRECDLVKLTWEVKQFLSLTKIIIHITNEVIKSYSLYILSSFCKLLSSYNQEDNTFQYTFLFLHAV